MLSFLFGKKKKKVRSVKRKGSRKPPANLIKACRKYKIKCTKKVGGRRVYKKISVIRKLISNKLKKRRLPSNTYSGSLRNRKKVRKTRRTRFGLDIDEWNQREMRGPVYVHHISALKKIIKDTDRTNSTMMLTELYNLAKEHGQASGVSVKEFEIMKQFLPKYGKYRLDHIMNL